MAMTSSALTRIEEFFNQRGFQPSQAVSSPQRLTFENPHSCTHCQDEFIGLQVQPLNSESIICTCGVQTSVPDPQVCAQCSAPLSTILRYVYSAELTRGLEEALVAAESGCALYQYLVTSLAEALGDIWDIKKPWLSMGRFKVFGTHFSNEPSGCSMSIEFSAKEKKSRISMGHVQAWATENSRASRYIAARPYEQQVDSVSSWNFARQSLKTCRESHPRCRLGSPSHGSISLPEEMMNIRDVPSRLLDAEPTGGGEIRLVEVINMSDAEKKHLCCSGYVALSYCWGGQQQFTLKKGTSSRMLAGFGLLQLPKTIQDAFRVVRELGLRYLWVDALCIYQDDDHDKENEIGRMAEYYGNSAVTICAAASSAASQGFLHLRPWVSFSFGPVRLRLVNVDGTDESHIYLVVESNMPPEPIVTRGWTMQESLLSRRLLIYDSRQLYWCCLSSMAGCGGLITSLSDKGISTEPSLVEDIYPMGSVSDLPIEVQLGLIVTNYTSRSLGYPGDKFLAISALVARLLQLSKARGHNLVYVVGLLMDPTNENYCHIQLLWCPVDSSKTHRSSVYRSPSWSWAAVDGRIRPGALGGRYPSYVGSRNGDSSTREYKVTPNFPNLPFGSIKEAFLTLEAKARQLSACMVDAECPLTVKICSLVDEITEDSKKHRINKEATLRLLPDTSEDAQDIEAVVIGKGANNVKITLVAITLDAHGSSGSGIIARPHHPGSWARAGTFTVIGESKFDPPLPTPHGIFAKTSFSPIKLV